MKLNHISDTPHSNSVDECGFSPIKSTKRLSLFNKMLVMIQESACWKVGFSVIKK